MKVACPNCGQHYDVAANALDRYFRCTECKMLFLGLNAKSVKIQKFKRKNQGDDSADQIDISGNTDMVLTDSAEISETVEIAESELTVLAPAEEPQDAAEENGNDTVASNKTVAAMPVEVNWGPDEIVEDDPSEGRFFGSGLNLAILQVICGAVVLVLLVAMMVIWNGKINNIRSVHSENHSRINDMQNRIESLERQIDALSREAARLRENVIDLERKQNRVK